MLKTKLKVGSVKSLTDGRYFAAMGAEWMGFSFIEENARFIEHNEAKEIMDWLSGPRFIGEFGYSDIDKINNVSEQIGLKSIQITHSLDLSKLSSQIESLIQRIEVTADNFDSLALIMDEQRNWTSQFVLDFSAYSTEKLLTQQELIADLCADYPVFLKMQFSPQNILEILENTKPFGIEILGGEELSTGLQSFEEVDEILELLE